MSTKSLNGYGTKYPESTNYVDNFLARLQGLWYILVERDMEIDENTPVLLATALYRRGMVDGFRMAWDTLMLPVIEF